MLFDWPTLCKCQEVCTGCSRRHIWSVCAWLELYSRVVSWFLGYSINTFKKINILYLLLLLFICVASRLTVTGIVAFWSLNLFTNLFKCSKCLLISVARTMSMIIERRARYSSLFRFLNIFVSSFCLVSWKANAAWWFSKTALEKIIFFIYFWLLNKQKLINK